MKDSPKEKKAHVFKKYISLNKKVHICFRMTKKFLKKFVYTPSKNKMTYKPIENFNNRFFLDVKNSFEYKLHVLSIILKTTQTRDLQKYIRADTTLKYNRHKYDSCRMSNSWENWTLHKLFPIQNVISLTLRCDSGAGANTYF